jgi:hypothetical protein
VALVGLLYSRLPSLSTAPALTRGASHSTAKMNAPHPAEHIVLNEDEKKSAHGVN